MLSGERSLEKARTGIQSALILEETHSNQHTPAPYQPSYQLACYENRALKGIMHRACPYQKYSPLRKHLCSGKRSSLAASPSPSLNSSVLQSRRVDPSRPHKLITPLFPAYWKGKAHADILLQAWRSSWNTQFASLQFLKVWARRAQPRCSMAEVSFLSQLELFQHVKSSCPLFLEEFQLKPLRGNTLHDTDEEKKSN